MACILRAKEEVRYFGFVEATFPFLVYSSQACVISFSGEVFNRKHAYRQRWRTDAFMCKGPEWFLVETFLTYDNHLTPDGNRLVVIVRTTASCLRNKAVRRVVIKRPRLVETWNGQWKLFHKTVGNNKGCCKVLLPWQHPKGKDRISLFFIGEDQKKRERTLEEL